jgi:hypothetical protein
MTLTDEPWMGAGWLGAGTMSSPQPVDFMNEVVKGAVRP